MSKLTAAKFFGKIDTAKKLTLNTYSVMQSDGNSFLSEMSSRAALTGYTVFKTAFKTKNMKTETFGIFIIKILYL